MDKVVFLDRDGTINEEVHYLYRPEDFKFLPGVPGGPENAHGFRLQAGGGDQPGRWQGDITARRTW